MELENMIVRTISFSDIAVDDASLFNVAYGIDQNFLYGCGVSIASLLLHNSNIKFSFHVFIDQFSEVDEIIFNKLSAQYNTKISIYIIDADNLSSMPTTKNWSSAIYFRFIIAEFFKNSIDKILYLDADIICNNSIDELIKLNINNHIVAAVTERNKDWWLNRAEKLACEAISAGYFNTGVLYINLKSWAEQDITAKSLNLLRDNEIQKKLSYPDQDVLNILLVNNVLFLDIKYNTQYSLNYELKKSSFFPVNKETIFIHYIGPTKPWHEWADYPTAQAFIDARNASPWENIPLLKAKSSNHLRYCAKHRISNKKYMSGLISYINYFYKKLKSL